MSIERLLVEFGGNLPFDTTSSRLARINLSVRCEDAGRRPPFEPIERYTIEEPPPMEQETQDLPIGPLGAQIEVAHFSHDNMQAIVRQLDTKAGVFITLLVFLATGILPLAKDVCAKLHWSGPGAVSSWAYFISALVLVGGLVATAVAVQGVIRPRGSERKGVIHGISFSRDILDHRAPEFYHEVTAQMTEDVLLHTLNTQNVQLSRIVQRKTDALQIARWPTMISFVAWALNCAVSFYILTWR